MWSEFQIDAQEHRVEEHLGREALFLRGGLALLPAGRFRDGVVDVDVCVDGGRGFTGVVWRAQDGDNLEWFYIRPHQSGNPDATQYDPVFNGVSAWQLYHGERWCAPLVHRVGEWFHVRVVVTGSVAEIYVGDLEVPAQRVDGLRREPAAGMVGVGDGGFAGSWFANLTWSDEPPPLRGAPHPPEPEEPLRVRAWEVAGQRVEAEPSGLVNLARHVRKAETDTAAARVVLRSEREQLKRVDFGFSDRVQVSLNGRLLYAGDDTYRSRDYRFLGSIGWWDSLWLPLERGDNELVLAVSEDFGGWGLQARLEDWDGVTMSVPGN